MVENTMEAVDWLRKQVEDADADLLRDIVQVIAEGLMGADADALCGAAFGERTSERTNQRKRLPQPALGHPSGNDRP